MWEILDVGSDRDRIAENAILLQFLMACCPLQHGMQGGARRLSHHIYAKYNKDISDISIISLFFFAFLFTCPFRNPPLYLTLHQSIRVGCCHLHYLTGVDDWS